MSRRPWPLVVALSLTLAACVSPRTAPVPDRAVYERYPIVPWPRRLTPRPGELVLDARTRIVIADGASAELRDAVDLLVAPLREASGLPLPLSDVGPAGSTTIAIGLATSAPTAEAEGYFLDVTERGVSLSAPTVAGVLHGLQTLRQLLPPALDRGLRARDRWPADSGVRAAAAEPTARWTIPAVTIEDAPRFAWRGALLDVARYYYPPSFLRELVDLLALQKLNVLQLHLTDDQGWRLEIRKYPRLTTVGAWRKETQLGTHYDPYVGDGTPHGGFYSQQEIRDLVAYAAARHVTIVPEIEMPGHAGAALAAYPELACTAGPFEVSTKWSVHEEIFCPSERTIAFLEDVLTEVMELFPSEYIHIGGDEAPKTRWKASPVAQEIIAREHLANEEQLQSWFTRRIERFLREHGRKLIGWDEILEGGIAPEATVMSWRGMEGGIAAAKQGHDVVMSPGDWAYLDHYQGDPAQEPLAIGDYLPLDRVYAFEPVPPTLTRDEARHVIGAQGNLWTEYIATPRYAEYMLFPRLFALAEVAWSPPAARDWNGFLARLPAQLARLDAMGVEYRVPEPLGDWGDQKVLETRTRFTIASPVAGATIRYTTDGTDPTPSSPAYTAPVELHVDGAPATVSARLYLPGGRSSIVARARVARTTWTPAVNVRADALRPGLTYAYAEGTFASADSVRGATPARSGTVPTIGLRGDERAEQWGLRLGGWLRVPGDAVYSFYLVCDDGAKLRIDDTLVVDHDGEHATTEKRGQVALRAGWHRIEVLFFQAGGGVALQADVAAPGLARRPIPAEWLAHER